MLRFVLTDVYDNEIVLEKAVAVSINIDEDVPCDDMVVVFPYFATKELKRVVVYEDSDVVFTGIVDEHISFCSKNNRYIKLVCRSMAAYLVDNESVPISYNHPTTQVIANNHVLPYGISMGICNDKTYFGVQTVIKGMSDWGVVEDFFLKVYNKKPRINACGQLVIEHDKEKQAVVFSSDSQGITYHSFKQDIKRCEELSQVNVKVINSCGYNNVIKNQTAIDRGINARRYINSVYTDTPAVYAEKMINNSSKKAFVITLSCYGRYLDLCTKNAVVKNSMCGDIENLYISSIKYSLKNNEDVTVFTLKRKEV